ncbi:Cell division and transport-associated protein TolR [Geoalkalibacter ferrihydriticus]|uniref:Cell division and transport-associated protein TolR n=1 Tax=Geoalkalibacter ferrihydriticus TaxID=392333 RepID=A0A1G9MBR2_9BACT|nr:ExbD/TolR family protein [Geoalkalibacter ferrihydriticus]SDL71712.1 Cell division and transport-associated protein TolR [Geoalkalibacter ferrihydriticus]
MGLEVGRRDAGGRRMLSQINVTPFVDVMLVLLIMFMVTVPMMQSGVEVNLPEVADAPTLDQVQDPLVVSVTRGGEISIGQVLVESPEQLLPVLRQVMVGRETQEVFLEADRDVPYGRVVQVMAAIRGAGIEKLGMIAQPPEEPASRRR